MTGAVNDVGVMALFFFMMVFMDTTATIPTGAMAERWAWKNFCLYGLWVALPYCLYANWVWGGGWLAQGGLNWGLGHGAVDFAGSGVVHAMGGIIALAGAMVIGPRIGKYDSQGQAAGACRVTTCRWSSSARSSWPSAGSASIRARPSAGTDLRISFVVVNTMLASITGAIGSHLVALRERPQARPDDDVQRHARRTGRDHGAVRVRRPVGGGDHRRHRRRACRAKRLLLRERAASTIRSARSPCTASTVSGACSRSASSPPANTAPAGTASCATRW